MQLGDMGILFTTFWIRDANHWGQAANATLLGEAAHSFFIARVREFFGTTRWAS